MNAFESGNGRSELPELFHSEFLGAALRISLKAGKRNLFDDVWSLCAPDDWKKPPVHALVITEQRVNKGERIDICLVDDDDVPPSRVVGIEVKTKRASAEKGQLGRYLEGLQKEFPDASIEMAYLTPFNPAHAGENANRLRTVQVFADFENKGNRGKHVSWIDVASIDWDGGMFWREHQSYILDNMASKDQLQRALSRNRSFEAFFGAEATDRFFAALPSERTREHDDPVILDLKKDTSSSDLVNALKILIEDGENVVPQYKSDRFPPERREHFTGLEVYGDFHKAMFDLSDCYTYVWLQGKSNYGLRVAHKNHSGGVSLATSQGDDRLLIGQRR